MRLSARVPAKVNLHLQVVGRRPDGFHEVRTLLQSIDLFDDLTVEEAPGGGLEVEMEPADWAPAGDSNLVLRAARRLEREPGMRPGSRFILNKRIPAAGGMGGGSADAAAALVLLDSFWDLDLGRSRLQAYAAELGSDVPFFLHGGLALGIGRGEEGFPLPDLDPMGVVILFPDVQIPTTAAYGMLGDRLTWCRPEANVYAFAAGLDVRPSWKDMFNDLQASVLEGWPVVGEAIRALRDTEPLRVGVSGSGGAVFGLYPDRAAAKQVGEVVRKKWRIHVGRTLGRAEARPTVRRQEG